MKKLLALLLALTLICPALAEPAQEESAPLTREELEIYADALVNAALEKGAITVVTSQDGPTVAFTGCGSLTIADDQLTQTTALLDAALAVGQACPRGLEIGSTLEEVMQVYPNDNPQLLGTYYDAALYVSGEKPEITAGWILREGQRVTQITHCVYAWGEDGVGKCGVTYTLDQGYVTDIEVFGLGDRIEEEQALAELAEVSQMQEQQEYFAYPQSASADLTPFGREDLAFGGLDFLDLTPEMALNALGDSPVDEWMEDSNGEYLRLREWEGVSILFRYNAKKEFLHVDSLAVNEDTLEGPRGVRVGDYMETVVNRFQHGQGGSDAEGQLYLYGQSDSANYGVISYSTETVAITYAFALEGQNVLWQLTFANGALQSMRMLLR